MYVPHRRSKRLLYCIPQATGRRAFLIRCAIGADQPSHIRQLISAAKASKPKVFSSFIYSKPLQTLELTRVSLALPTFESAKHHPNIDHLGVAATT